MPKSQGSDASRPFVRSISADKWVGILDEGDELVAPSWDDAARLIDALDAETRTMVTMLGPDGRHIVVGGGGGQYVVYVAGGKEHYFNLISEARYEGVILLNCGGQVGDFPARQVAERASALRAAETFFHTGELDRSLVWDEQK